MKILVIGKEEKSLAWIQLALKKQKIECEILKLNIENQPFTMNFMNIIADCHAVIVDRIPCEYFDMSKIRDIDLFFIVNSITGILNSEITNGGENVMYRFYRWPANIFLLIDDLKSLIAVKTHINHGVVKVNDLVINLQARSVSFGNNSIYLKNKEFELLCYLSKHRGTVLTRNNLLEQVWDMNTRVLTNTVDVHISKLRKVLKQSFGMVTLIKTIPCIGYIIP